MALSWIERTKLFKSPIRVVAGFLPKSWEAQAANKKPWQEECQKHKAELKRQADWVEEQRRENSRLKRQVEMLQSEVAFAAPNGS